LSGGDAEVAYDLRQLTSWVRRAGGDIVQTAREQLIADGSRRIALSNEGAIALTTLEIDNVEATTGFSVDGNFLTFDVNAIPATGTEIYVVYTVSRFSDAEILQFQEDSARAVGSDLAIPWVTASGQIVNADAIIYDAVTHNPDEDLEKLFVYRTAMAIAQAKAQMAADDSVKIKDADTSIDTAVTGSSANKLFLQMSELYESNLKAIRSRRFSGIALRDWLRMLEVYPPFDMVKG
jgi:hypothetical protein